MGCTIGITLYYIFTGEPLHSPLDLPAIAPVERLPEFFSLVIFAMECIGVVSSSYAHKYSINFAIPLLYLALVYSFFYFIDNAFRK